MILPKNKWFEAFAMIVDLNGFTRMVDAGKDELIADFAGIASLAVLPLLKRI